MFWRKSKHMRRDYTAEATELFGCFAAKHGLTYVVVDDAPIEVLWEFPVQEKLYHPITLGLQNEDELNFGVGDFWSYYFPFDEKHDEFQRDIDSWIEGQAKIVPKPGLFFQTIELQVLSEGQWKTSYAACSLSFRKPILTVLMNVVQGQTAPE